jgi:hypothetical protein
MSRFNEGSGITSRSERPHNNKMQLTSGGLLARFARLH